MICKKCHEHIETGEPMRAEPVQAGSSHHVFYHVGCYAQVKQERQSVPLEEQVRLAGMVH
jgi:hypothetical protein